ncbi:hypothetical protein GVN16_11145 [Emticicia sp. CRIBPO]|uniref:PD-(D/E)XK nuclease family protein n=1 Tax=Emticicia sp. CRIBPO TaxID=2683258 RepID=UPI00141266F9|nr:PD-(D/E)XK nuclease family protein [Emticicia sp. CRIBPO]NBA86322.1 hypothetical protein [Emticicia sp. CRIBPO]
MQTLEFQFYPTLLNEFGRYIRNPDETHFRQLLNRINRVPDFDEETLKRFQKGMSFEDAVLKNKPSSYDPVLLEKVRSMLPKRRVTQKLIRFTHENIRFYGYADVVGERRVIDLKTTSSYQPNKFAFNFQNLYLYALRNEGCDRMDYIIYDFREVYVETYYASEYDFGLMLHQMELFAEFLNENRKLIRDKKIFIDKPFGDGLFEPGF